MTDIWTDRLFSENITSDFLVEKWGLKQGHNFAFEPLFQLGKHKITAQCHFPTVVCNCYCKTGLLVRVSSLDFSDLCITLYEMAFVSIAIKMSGIVHLASKVLFC